MASTEDEIRSLIRSRYYASKEERMKILESYVGIAKLKKPLTLEEIFELEEDNWL